MHKREVASLQAEILLRLRAVLRAWRDLRGQELDLCMEANDRTSFITRRSFSRSNGIVLAGVTLSSSVSCSMGTEQ
jgi:hypothetical protein